MIIVTHEMHFAREVSSKVVFMSDGLVVEEGIRKTSSPTRRKKRPSSSSSECSRETNTHFRFPLHSLERGLLYVNFLF